MKAIAVLSEYIRSCERSARAGDEVLRQWRGHITVREKGRADLVTEADLASQRLIKELVSKDFPSHSFVGEEDGTSTLDKAAEYCWIVDPLDGTTNYVHGLPGWCVSVALTHNGRPEAGCVYDVDRDICYSANRGDGAFSNGVPISTSKTDRLGDALVAVSFPAEVDRESPEIASFLELLPRVRAFRRLGSAALNLCYVATGQLDAYWTGNIKPWDVAAGVLILQEAGGVATSMYGEPHQVATTSLAAAGSVQLHHELVAQLSIGIR